MCTAVNMRGAPHLFGRTLDLERGFGEEVVITPAGFSFGAFRTKYSIIGVGAVRDNTPLYFDGMNEAGLCAAALNYPNFAVYKKEKQGALNLPSFQLLPFVLGSCASVAEARAILSGANITDSPFSAELPPTPLHWLISDGEASLCAEPDEGGLVLHDNPFHVLTNAPSFEYHRLRVCDLMGVSPLPPENRIFPRAELSHYSRGLGAMGLPGDFSSSSRFLRALFSLEHTRRSQNTISDFFHIMDTVSIPCGAVIAENGAAVQSLYTCCADTNNLIYYFTTYGCRRIRGVRLNGSCGLARFSMERDEDIEILSC